MLDLNKLDWMDWIANCHFDENILPLLLDKLCLTTVP